MAPCLVKDARAICDFTALCSLHRSTMPSCSCLHFFRCFGHFVQSPLLPSNATLERMREQREPFSIQPKVIFTDNSQDTNLYHIFPQISLRFSLVLQIGATTYAALLCQTRDLFQFRWSLGSCCSVSPASRLSWKNDRRTKLLKALTHESDMPCVILRRNSYCHGLAVSIAFVGANFTVL